tara:strand:+ start:964 stop:1140 length:177 start_codon:yes stop_codon:yes gene_type:complete
MNIQSVKKLKRLDTEILDGFYVTDTNGVVHNVPQNEENTDYQAILQWVADGNTIEEAD